MDALFTEWRIRAMASDPRVVADIVARAMLRNADRTAALSMASIAALEAIEPGSDDPDEDEVTPIGVLLAPLRVAS